MKYLGGHQNPVEADILSINNRHYLCIVYYHSTFQVRKKVEGLSTDKLIKMCKIIFSEYRLPSKLVSDVSTNYISEKFENYCR